MLEVHTCAKFGGKAVPVDLASGDLPDAQAVWIDVLQPSEEEIAFIRRTTDLDVPSYEQLVEVESSSRVRNERGALYLSLPVAYRVPTGEARTTPVGLILTPHRLVTIRYENLKSFEAFRDRIQSGGLAHPGTEGVFVALLEAIVDRLADVLEEVGDDLDTVAEAIFIGSAELAADRGAKKAEDARLRGTLRQVGRDRQRISKVRATLLGIARIVPFVEGESEDWMPKEAQPHFGTLKQDVASLDEYETHLSDKVQFLLDAALGFINIEQNDTFRVLTLVSVVGIPPTLVASMYGMNFKHMPELDWAWGYLYGLTLIALSAVVPLVYFKHRGWF